MKVSTLIHFSKRVTHQSIYLLGKIRSVGVAFTVEKQGVDNVSQEYVGAIRCRFQILNSGYGSLRLNVS